MVKIVVKNWQKFGSKIERKKQCEMRKNVERNVLSWRTQLKICSRKPRNERHLKFVQKIEKKREKKNLIFTHVGEVNGAVPFHNGLHLLQRLVAIAAQLETQRPIGRECRQPNKLGIQPQNSEWQRFENAKFSDSLSNDSIIL